MTKSRIKRIWVILLAMLIVLSCAGCGANITPDATGDETVASNQLTTATTDSITETTEDETSASSTEPEETTVPTEGSTEPGTESPVVMIPSVAEKDEYGLTEQQRNSFSMLYYLAITAEEIRMQNVRIPGRFGILNISFKSTAPR